MRTQIFTISNPFWLLLLSILLPFYPLLGQTLVQQSPNVLLQTVNDVAIQPNGRGLAITNNNVLLSTTDFGANWTEGPSSIAISSRLAAIPGGNGQQFLATAYEEVKISTDAGATWTSGNLPAIDNLGFLRLYAVPSANTLYIGGRTAILKSTDGGLNWVDISPAVPGANWNSLSFANTSTGWVSTEEGGIYRTQDGGQNWEPQNTSSFSVPVLVSFLTTQVGFATVFRDLYKTTNGGQTWNVVRTNIFGSHQTQLLVLDEQHLVSTQGGLGIYVSQDGGLNFTSDPALPYGYNYQYLTGFPDGRVWVACSFGSIAFSEDFGQTFEDQLPGFKYQLNNIDFSDSAAGWAVGQTGAIARTPDGGDNWQIISNIPPDVVVDGAPDQFFVKSYSYDEALICAYRSVYYTPDGGESWETAFAAPANNLFVDADARGDKMWVLTNRERVHYTADRGQTWAESTISNGFSYLSFIHFASDQVGFAGGGTTASTLYKSTDGGATWNELPEFSTVRLTEVWFLNEQEGWALSEAFTNQLFHTTDGGSSWETITLPASSYWRGFYAADSQTIDIFGGSSGFTALYRSTDGGQTWAQVLVSYEAFFQDYARQNIPNGYTYWFCGTAGWIGRVDFLSTGLPQVSVEDLSISPNPTQGTVRLHIPDQWALETASLSITDSQGRQVYAQAAQRELSLGHLPAGLYTIRLQQGQAVYLAKLVMVHE